jgi:hypothetical protein
LTLRSQSSEANASFRPIFAIGAIYRRIEHFRETIPQYSRSDFAYFAITKILSRNTCHFFSNSYVDGGLCAMF